MGFYSSEGATSKYESACPEGTYGDSTGLGSGACSGACDPGYYCPEPEDDDGNCAYSSVKWTGTKICSGSQTATPSDYLCAAGRYGGKGQTESTCSGACPAGYFCLKGTATDAYTPCGAAIYYCPEGSANRTAVDPGYYSTGGSDETLRTGQSAAEAGYYATNGTRFPCAAGYYGSSSGLTDKTCSGQCDAGFRCSEGSTSGTATPCGYGVGKPASVYCEQGSANYTEVTEGYYTTPVTNPSNQREGQAVCPSDKVCRDGELFDVLEWNICPTEVEVDEGSFNQNLTYAGIKLQMEAESKQDSSDKVSYSFATIPDFSLRALLYYDMEGDANDDSGNGRGGTASGKSKPLSLRLRVPQGLGLQSRRERQ